MKSLLFALAAFAVLAVTATAATVCKCTDCGGKCCPCECKVGCC